jgi:hypothetical protein
LSTFPRKQPIMINLFLFKNMNIFLIRTVMFTVSKLEVIMVLVAIVFVPVVTTILVLGMLETSLILFVKQRIILQKLIVSQGLIL